jgi:VanZ family protein
VFAWDFALKKTAHMFVYFVLFRLIYRAIIVDVKNPLKASIISFILCLLYAISDEYHQSFVPGRTPTGKDLLFDILGMAIAWLSVFKYI